MASGVEQLSARQLEVLNLIQAGCSDREIARKLFISVNTVKWHNRQIYARLDVSSRTEAVRAADELGLLGEKEDAPASQPSRIPHNLPAPVSSFVGREKEITEIIDLIRNHRLVTITGPGGVGKTRLALEVGISFTQENSFPDGIFFIDLAPVSLPSELGAAIVEGLKLSPPPEEPVSQTLTRVLGDQKRLLLLDNFEHMLKAVPLVSELLISMPDLRILCTSREALNITGEQLYLVEPLGSHHSQELFIQRSRAVNPEFEPAKKELSLIDQICSRLDHLPLTVELAAARMNIFNLERLNHGLEDRFSVLTRAPRDLPERQQTLEQAIDWSYGLLDEKEQILFRRLAVFQGSRTFDAVEDVCCFDIDIDVMIGLESLLLKNLIRQKEGLDGESRFYLLESLHSYGWKKLSHHNEDQMLRQRHAEYFVSLVARAKNALYGSPEKIHWLTRLEADFQNLKLTYNWAINHGKHSFILKLVHGLTSFWWKMGHHPVGRTWTQSALEIIDYASLPVQAGIYEAAAQFSLRYQAYEQFYDQIQNALNSYHTLGDQQGIGRCHLAMLTAQTWRGDPDDQKVMKHFRTAIEMFEDAGDDIGASKVWTSLGGYAELIGDRVWALEAYQDGLFFAQQTGDLTLQLYSMVCLAGALYRTGDVEAAHQMLKEVLQIEWNLYKDSAIIGGTFELLAGPEMALGSPFRAVVLLSVGDSHRRKSARNKGRFETPETHKRTVEQYLKKACNKLEESEFSAAWKIGQEISIEDAVDFATKKADHKSSVPEQGCTENSC